MADVLYPKGKEAILAGGIQWKDGGHNFKVCLLSSTYVYNAAHDFHDDLSGIVATSGNLGTLSNTNGQAGAANITIESVTGDQVVAFVIFRDSGVSGTSELIAFIDSATGLPVTPNGGDIQIQWDTYIFAL